MMLNVRAQRATAAVLLAAFTGTFAPAAAAAQNVSSAGAAASPVVPAGYVIGPQDMLSIVFWKDNDLSSEVTVRPDGKISLPLLNEVQAAGYTPEELRIRLEAAAAKFVEDPNATVVVREIKSRQVFITGAVTRPSSYQLNGEMTILQLIALAGGLLEYADSKNIVIIRQESGRPEYRRFNYNDVIRQKNIEQNIVLQPGDTIVVK